jgi:hypothetical protein
MMHPRENTRRIEPNIGPLIVLGEGRLNFGHLWCPEDPEGRFFQADTKRWWQGRLGRKCGHHLECETV